MSKYAKNLISSRINTKNGPAGKIKDILFNDENWKIKHLVLNKHKWVPFGSVLLEPGLIECPQGHAKVVTEIRRADIKNYPSEDEDPPVAKQKALEKQMERMGLSNTAVKHNAQDKGQQNTTARKKDPHLRSMKEIIGYKIHATDGLIGTVSDFSINLDNWSVEGIVLKNGPEGNNDNDLITTSFVQEFIWVQRKVSLNAPKENVVSK